MVFYDLNFLDFNYYLCCCFDVVRNLKKFDFFFQSNLFSRFQFGSNFFDFFFKKNLFFKKKFNDLTENSRLWKRQISLKTPFRLVKNNISGGSFFFFWGGDGISNCEVKDLAGSHFLVLKQKKYLVKNTLLPSNSFVFDDKKVVRYSGQSVLIENSYFDLSQGQPVSLYRSLKKNKKKNELIPITLSKRLLRTKKTLILPAHVNITLITNSFDIVHSWFLPGLGIKLDCVPGRSTHHTFYVDNIGFYFGQCAEICGRYHHHMPIRVCALPFEHFLV